MPGDTSTASASRARPSMVQCSRWSVGINSTLRNFPSSSISHFKVIKLLLADLALQLLQPAFELPARFGWGWCRFFGFVTTIARTPERGGNRCRVPLARTCFHVVGGRDRGFLRLGQKIVQPPSVYVAGLKIAGGENPSKKSQVRLDSSRVKLSERPPQPRDSFFAVLSGRD